MSVTDDMFDQLHCERNQARSELAEVLVGVERLRALAVTDQVVQLHLGRVIAEVLGVPEHDAIGAVLEAVDRMPGVAP